ncbi:MAG: hypothetical protein Q8M31_19795 [Beijerinckiaceae bacterium]|nr:hypothetical protein [Beijerinckiaceae bacterium]
MSLPTVLLALSDPRTNRAMSTGLQRFGYENLTATDQCEALSILATKGQIDVMIIDADAPEGLALGHGVRRAHPNVAIVYTSEAPQKIAEHTIVSGSPMLRSPFAPHLLAGVVAALGRRASLD